MPEPTNLKPGDRFNAPDPYVDPKRPETAKPRPVTVLQIAQTERRGVTAWRVQVRDETSGRRTWMLLDVAVRCRRLPRADG